MNEIRVEKKLSLRDLERLSTVSKSALNKIENHELNPSQVTMVLVARALKMEVGEIFDLTY